MSTLITKVRIIDPFVGIDTVDDVYFNEESLTIAPGALKDSYRHFDGAGKILLPGLIDLHVHFREPGFCHKEDISSGIRAALAGGVTSAMVMPNTNPALDCPKRVMWQKSRAEKNHFFDLMVAAAATEKLKGEKLNDLASLKSAGATAITDDGYPILDHALMEELLRLARRHNLLVMQHAEDTRLSCGHAMHEGKVSQKLGIKGQPREAESSLVERDIKLAVAIGARYHVLHLSCKESLALVRKAKRDCAHISCEVAPHHLLLNDTALRSADSLKKMNPPLRNLADSEALIEGINDGTVEALASDHAPHSAYEKKQDLTKSPFGVIGLETAILCLLTLVHQQKISLKRAIELMTTGPARIVQREGIIGTLLAPNAKKNMVLIDPNFHRIISYRDFYGRSKNSAFLGMELFGRVLASFINARLVFSAV
jgi:dihydroorotase